MEKVILTQLSTDDLKDIIYEVMTKVIEEKKLQMLPDEKKYLTRKEVAKKFHVSLSTIHAWINAGKIKAMKMGRRTLFDMTEVDSVVSPKYKRLNRY